MTELIRDTAFGHIVRFVSRGKLLQYAEERDPSIYTRYLDEKKSGYLAHHGDTNPPEDDEEPELAALGGARTREEKEEKRRSSSRSSRTEVGDDVNHASGVKVDPEKGKNIDVVGWYGDDDTEVSGETIFASFIDEACTDHDFSRAEPSKLGSLQEVFRHFPTVSAYAVRLHRFLHLHLRSAVRDGGLWRKPGRSSPRIVPVRCWLRSR